MGLPKSWRFLLIALVISIVLTQEADARRVILKGRRTITRTYLTDPALPAWAVILLIGIAEIIGGAIAYFIMKKVIIDPPITGSYTPANVDEV